jgi:hypothetical protein
MMQVGLLPLLGGCQAWQLHRPSLSLVYSRELWLGSSQELTALRKPITAGSQVWIRPPVRIILYASAHVTYAVCVSCM